MPPPLILPGASVTLLCQHCRRSLGVTTAVMLRLDNVIVRQTLTLECAHCGKRRRWRPLIVSGELDAQTAAHFAAAWAAEEDQQIQRLPKGEIP